MAKKKTDNPELEQKALTAFEISRELALIVEKVVESSGEITEEQSAAMKEWQGELGYKAHNICWVEKNLDAEIEKYKVIEDIAKTRRKANEAAKERLRKYLLICMEEAGIEKIKTDLFTISKCAGRIAVKIDDEGKIPETLTEMRVIYKPVLDAIKTKLEAGEDVPGAHLEQNEPYLIIR